MRVALWGDSSALQILQNNPLSAEEWLQLYSLSLRQGVCALVLDAAIASKIEIPRSVKMKFIVSTAEIESKYQQKISAIKQLSDIYSANNIDLTILKGVGLAQLYPVPNHRPCSDVDIWLSGKQELADSILQQQYGITIDQAHHHHTVFYINKVMIENHYDFIEQHSRLSKASIEKHLKLLSATEESIKMDIEGINLSIPSPNLNALFLIMHSGSHFAAENISVRHLVDWAMFLKYYNKQIDWNALAKTGKDFGFMPFLQVLNAMTIEYVGMPRELAVYTTDDKELITKSINDVLLYKYDQIPDNFIQGWKFRLKRRFSNSWKQKLVYKDDLFSAFFLSFLTHIIHPNIWKKYTRK